MADKIRYQYDDFWQTYLWEWTDGWTEREGAKNMLDLEAQYGASCLKDKLEMEHDSYEIPVGDTFGSRACYSCDVCGEVIEAPVENWSHLYWEGLTEQEWKEYAKEMLVRK